MTFHGTPTTLAQYVFAADCPACIGTYDDDVSPIAWTQETAFLHAEKARRIVGHQLYQLLYGEYAVVDHLQHGDQGDLNHGHAACSTGTTSFLLLEQMGSMVSTDGGDTTVGQCLLEGFAVTLSLDGGVTLDACAQTAVVAVAEVQMADGGFAGDG